MRIKTSIDRFDIRLFLMFLLLFTFFIHWGGTNAWSRYDLTRSIVDDGSVEISNYSYNTMDKRTTSGIENYINTTNHTDLDWEEKTDRFVKGQERAFKNSSAQIYTDKAPVSSFLAIPGYVIGDYVSEGVGQEKELWVENRVDSIPAKLSFETSLEQFIIVFTVSVITGSILLVLIFKHLQGYVDRQTAIYATVVAGLATPLVYYATSFFGVINAALFLFASYMAIQKVLNARDRTEWMYVAGMLSALAISTEYYSAIVVMGFLLYLVVQKKIIIWIPKFTAGLFVGAIPLIVYNIFTTGNPFIPISMLSSGFGPGPINAVCSTYQACFQGNTVMGLFVIDPVRMLKTFVRLLFFESRGVFFYSPILLLSIPGAYELYNRDRKLVLIFPGAFFALLMFQASILNWLGGASFGPRYAIVGLPFLILPVALGLKKIIDKGRIWKIIVFLIFFISLFNSFLGFNSLPGIEMDSEEYGERFNSFSAVQPEFYDRLVNEFDTYGARSEVLMSLTDRYKGFDTTYRNPYGPKYIELGSTGSKGILFSLNLVPLILVSTLLAVFLWKDFVRLRYVFVFIIILSAVFSIQVSQDYVLGEQYRDYSKAVLVNGSYITVFHSEERGMPHVRAKAYSTENTTSGVEMFAGNGIESLKARHYQDIYFPSATGSGRKEINPEIKGCLVPGLTNKNLSDPRCLSLSLENLSVVQPKSKDVFFSSWYDKVSSERVRWGDEDSKIYFYRKNLSGKKVLKLELETLQKNREINVTINNQTFSRVLTPYNNEYWFVFEPRNGLNKVSIDARGKCSTIGNFAGNDDSRCIEFGLKNFSVKSLSSLQGRECKVFGDVKCVKFGVKNNSIKKKVNTEIETRLGIIIGKSGKYSLSFKGSAVGGDSTITVKNEKKVWETEVDSFGSEFATPYFETDNFTTLEISSDCHQSCKYLKLENLQVTKYENQSRNKLYRFGSKWYSKALKEDYRWSKGNSSIYMYNYRDQSVNRTLWIEGKSFHILRNITYVLNSKELGKRKVFPTNYRKGYKTSEGNIYAPKNYPFKNPSGEEVHIENRYSFDVTLEPGENVLELKSPTKCISIGKVNQNNDVRCGFYGLKDLYLTESQDMVTEKR